MSEVTKVVSAENAPINSSMNYAKKYEASYEDSGGGSGGGVLLVNGTTDVNFIVTLDKTAGEILAALESGVVFVTTDQSYERTLINSYNPHDYEFNAAGSTYMASTADDYPTSGGIQ